LGTWLRIQASPAMVDGALIVTHEGVAQFDWLVANGWPPLEAARQVCNAKQMAKVRW